jgi:hypothetical protein
VGSKSTRWSTKKPKPNPETRQRADLIPKDYVLRIKPGKINNIFHELRRLRPKDHSNACAVMVRVFLELAVDDFIERHGMQSALGSRRKLADRVSNVADHLRATRKLTVDQLKPIRRAVSSDNLLAASIPTLHAYVHSLTLNPDPDSLKNAWDSLQAFLEAILPLE